MTKITRKQAQEALRAYYAGSAFEMGRNAVRDAQKGTFISKLKKPVFFAVPVLGFATLQVKLQNRVVVAATVELGTRTLVATCRPQAV